MRSRLPRTADNPADDGADVAGWTKLRAHPAWSTCSARQRPSLPILRSHSRTLTSLRSRSEGLQPWRGRQGIRRPSRSPLRPRSLSGDSMARWRERLGSDPQLPSQWRSRQRGPRPFGHRGHRVFEPGRAFPSAGCGEIRHVVAGDSDHQLVPVAHRHGVSRIELRDGHARIVPTGLTVQQLNYSSGAIKRSRVPPSDDELAR